jgi:hypothetical protein
MGRREEKLLMLDVASNHVRNTLATFARWILDLTVED